jgi:hypothetical protein
MPKKQRRTGAVQLVDCERRNGAANRQSAKVVASILAGSLPREDRTQQVESKKQQAGERPSSRPTLICGQLSRRIDEVERSAPYKKAQGFQHDSQIRRYAPASPLLFPALSRAHEWPLET